MRIYYGQKDQWMEADVTTKMLRQMKAWDKSGLANVSIIGWKPPSRIYLLLHVSRINMALTMVKAR